MHATTFVLSDVESGRSLGHGLICFSAKYATVAWLDENRLDRRAVSPAEWQMLQLAVSHGLPSTPLERTHVAVRVLVPQERRAAVAVQYVLHGRLEVRNPIDAAPELDEQLRRLAEWAT